MTTWQRKFSQKRVKAVSKMNEEEFLLAWIRNASEAGK